MMKRYVFVLLIHVFASCSSTESGNNSNISNVNNTTNNTNNNTFVNECGGTEQLGQSPGEACGACGTFVCDGINALSCDDHSENACGGCTELPFTVGSSCGDCNVYVCDGVDDVVCGTDGNGCGGCDELPGYPGTFCGECGEWVCDGQNNTVCEEQPLNECGGCGPLPGVQMERCDSECGLWACFEGGYMACVNIPFNGCGNCDFNMPSEANEGDVCCTDGVFECGDNDEVQCVGMTENTFTNPTHLGNYEDAFWGTLSTYVNSIVTNGQPEEWFKVHIEDTFDVFDEFGMRAQAHFIEGSPDAFICVYYDPAHSDNAILDCDDNAPSDPIYPDTYNGLKGCCGGMAWSHLSDTEFIELRPDAEGTIDETGDFYIRIGYTTTNSWDFCATYELNLALGDPI